MYKFMILLTLIVSTGCASNGVNPAAGVADSDRVQGEEQVADTTGDNNDEYEVICRRERSTGSRLAQRVCKTRYQIEKEREESQERLRQEMGVKARRTITSHPSSRN